MKNFRLFATKQHCQCLTIFSEIMSPGTLQTPTKTAGKNEKSAMVRHLKTNVKEQKILLTNKQNSYDSCKI